MTINALICFVFYISFPNLSLRVSDVRFSLSSTGFELISDATDFLLTDEAPFQVQIVPKAKTASELSDDISREFRDKITQWGNLLLTAILAFATLLQFHALRRTLKVSERAANAADTAAKASTSTIQASQRAYLFVKGIRFFRATDDKRTPREFFLLYIEVENVGQTPAINTQSFRDSRVFGLDIPETLPFTCSFPEEAKSITVGPKVSITLPPLIIEVEDLDKIHKRKARELIFVKMQYCTVFEDETHYTQFCGEIDVLGDINYAMKQDQIPGNLLNVMAYIDFNMST